MSNRQPSRATEPARAPSRATVAVLLVSVLAAAAACGVLPSAGSVASPVTATPRATAPPASATPVDRRPDAPEAPPGGAREGGRGDQGAAGGRLPDGVGADDDAYPGVARLDPALLDALRRASAAAEAHGVEVSVTSGWRSAAYQRRLLEEAVSTYGSRSEAARWVATPETSPHVSGDAVDLGPSDATSWLARHGAAYGLCRVFANEPWHFELRPLAVTHGCPAPYADPTRDPRMQR
ncbi:M15 family metallopeptidase [Oryzobacter terrae]|uniref:M15 family metallopeptidase n=1 Tax=Oryzobacter terrae TaxID=1620385 RepID=UPI0036729315